MTPNPTATVISGWATVSPLGIGQAAFTAGVLAGRAPEPVRPEGGPETIRARLVPDFDVRKVLGTKGTRSMDRVTGLAVTAVGQLVGSESLPAGTGLALGTSTGSAQSIMDFTRDSLVGARPYFVDPARFPNTVMNCAAGQCAIWHKLTGPNTTIAGGRGSGLLALQYALRLRRSGQAGSIICGAVEEFSSARAWLEHHARGSEGGGDVLGEGCAGLRLDDASESERGIAEVLRLDFGVWHRPEQLRESLARVVRRSLASAAVAPEEVWAVSPSGLSGTLGTQEEAAVADVFGALEPRRITCAELLGETAAASAAFQLSAVLATATGPDAEPGRIALVTSVDHDGGLGCVLVRLLAGEGTR